MFSVTIESTTILDEDQVHRLAAVGGAVSVSSDRFSVTLSDMGRDIVGAAARAAEHVALTVGLDDITGSITSVEVLTVAEADHRAAQPAFSELVGVAEVADILEVSRQRASQLQTNRDFPAPVAVLRSGPVWRKDDLSRFLERWERKVGRPAEAS